MKNKNILIIIFVVLTGIVSCQYLDVVPDNVATIDDAFVDRASAEGFLATCYSYLPNDAGLWANPALTSGDEVWINQEFLDDRSNIASTRIPRGFQNSNNPLMNFWDGGNYGTNLFIAIRDCNIFLENIDIPHDLSEAEKERWTSEVKFLKAYYHFYLMQLYGPIPIIRENLPVGTQTKDVKVYREPVDDVVDYIVNVIDEAAAGLPLNLESTTQEYGRITKPIALAMKARVLTTAASPLFNGNSDQSSMVDSRGIALFSSEVDETKWERAAIAAKEAIDICEQAAISLVNNYVTSQELSPVLERQAILRSIVTERESPELIWVNTESIFNQETQKAVMPTLINIASGQSLVYQYYAATLRMAELFYSDNGVPIEEDINYNYNERFNLQLATFDDKDLIEPGEETVGLHFNREPRFYANIAFDRAHYFLEGPQYYYVQARSGELASKRSKGFFSATGYYVKKLIHPKAAQNQNRMSPHFQFPFPIMRLADLYLLYAEALNEYSGPTSEALDYIDRVRERAGLSGVVESWTNYSSNPSKPNSKSGLREIIKQERLIELAFEGQRFWDLRRWKDAEKYLNMPIKGWNITDSGLGFYSEEIVYSPVFDFKDYFWPIKENEMIKNPNLIQNTGW